MAELDLVVTGGTVVSHTGTMEADVGVRDGVIAEVGHRLHGAVEISAKGHMVLPGGVDMHVHLSPSPDLEVTWVDDFESGTRAAAVGGVTTIGNMAFPQVGESLLSAMRRHESAADPAVIVDYLLHPVLIDASPQDLLDMEVLAADGYSSVKIFMVLETFDRDAVAFLEAMSEASKLGMTVMIHCEDGCLVSYITARAVREGRGSLQHYAESRPVYTELAAVERAIGFCRATGARTYIVHLSSAAALGAVTRALPDGLPLTVETRPLYLTMTEERLREPDGGLYTGMPPLRSPQDREALWAGLASGDIECLCTDHAPWRRDQKLDPAQDVSNVLAGVPELQTYLPLIFSEGVGSGRLSLERFVEVTATNTAKRFGLYPRKGVIAIGSDADLVIWDPNLTRRVTIADSVGKADYTPYEGWQVKGWPVVTVRRGDVIADHGKVLGKAGSGRRVRASASAGEAAIQTKEETGVHQRCELA